MADCRHREPRSLDHGRLLPGPASHRTLPGWPRSLPRAGFQTYVLDAFRHDFALTLI
ncbi:hypothetical protein IG631_13356 [Alternaria alternata]|nr:hypothetical protein IG631_13356 [Alternaria alternata]